MCREAERRAIGKRVDDRPFIQPKGGATSIEHILFALADALRALPLFMLYFAPAIVGGVFVWDSFIGALLLLVVFFVAYIGVRLSRNSRRHWVIRRLSLVAGVYCALLGLAAIPCAFIESAASRFSNWHAAGADLRPGQTLDEARRVLAQKSTVSEIEPVGFKGVCFQVEPIGLARYKFGFPLAELYYLDVAVSETGRVVTVKPRHD